MNPTNIHIAQTASATLATNKVIRNTYLLLAMTVLFSAVTATVATVAQIGPGLSLVSTIVAIGLLWFVLPRTEDSAAGVGVVFAVTGLLGFGLGPMLTHYLSIPGGSQAVAMAFGGTAVIFGGLSLYALTTRRDFSFMGGFLFTGLLVLLAASIANLFLSIPALSLGLSAGIIMLFSGFILFDTSRIINGGETNYLRATVALYIDVLNIFTSLLHLLGVGSDD